MLSLKNFYPSIAVLRIDLRTYERFISKRIEVAAADIDFLSPCIVPSLRASAVTKIATI